ncbi:BatD family protein [Glaciecola siphonariae]|uniref:BatD family protein n=1 Tax=Glaciecola siphonariae TaxID=521012 RepID=A0ABV9LRD7_9ALTE
MKVFYWAFCALHVLMMASISMPANADVSQLSATIDKNPMLIDESVTLQVTAIGGADSDAIDFLVLTKDFRVSQPSVSQSTQIINFDRTTSTTWTLQLLPKKTGQITIPSFTIDGKSSDPITLTVLPAGQGTRAQPRDFYVTAEVSNDTVYLQQQVRYTVKIYLAGDIQRGSLSEPVLDGAVIEQLGEDKEYQELVNGVRYRVIERNFAVLPQASGSFTIDGPVFQAEVLTSTRQSFAYFNRSKTISRMAPQKTINVLPIPQDYQYTWLPSERVQLDEQWSNDDAASFVQGEPITRTVTLTALGLIEEQLPLIEANYHPSFKTYPEQAERATVQQNERLIAQLVQRTAIIPGETGRFVLPEIQVPWFDVTTGETRFAVLPAKTVEVVAPAQAQGQNQGLDQGQANSETTQNKVQSSDDRTDLANNDELLSLPSSPFPLVVWGLDLLHFVLAGAVLVFAVITFVLRAKVSRLNALLANGSEYTQASEPSGFASNEADAWDALVNSITANNVRAIQSNLRHWLGVLTGTTIQSVNNALLKLDAKDAAEAFNQALQSQYADTSSAYDAQALKQPLVALRAREQNKYNGGSATNMYPIV